MAGQRRFDTFCNTQRGGRREHADSNRLSKFQITIFLQLHHLFGCATCLRLFITIKQGAVQVTQFATVISCQCINSLQVFPVYWLLIAESDALRRQGIDTPPFQVTICPGSAQRGELCKLTTDLFTLLRQRCTYRIYSGAV